MLVDTGGTPYIYIESEMRVRCRKHVERVPTNGISVLRERCQRGAVGLGGHSFYKKLIDLMTVY